MLVKRMHFIFLITFGLSCYFSKIESKVNSTKESGSEYDLVAARCHFKGKALFSKTQANLLTL